MYGKYSKFQPLYTQIQLAWCKISETSIRKHNLAMWPQNPKHAVTAVCSDIIKVQHWTKFNKTNCSSLPCNKLQDRADIISYCSILTFRWPTNGQSLSCIKLVLRPAARDRSFTSSVLSSNKLSAWRMDFNGRQHIPISFGWQHSQQSQMMHA